MLRTIASSACCPYSCWRRPPPRSGQGQKMETCKFGADDQKLTGAKRNAFIKHCMAGGNYEPPGRDVTKKPADQKAARRQPPCRDPRLQRDPAATTPAAAAAKA